MQQPSQKQPRRDWRARNADKIGAEIKAANQGRWPLTLAEWQDAAARYGLSIALLAPAASLPAAGTIDNLVYVRDTPDHALLCRRLCHEIAENIARRDGLIRPFHFADPDDAHHHVACLVEANAPDYIAAERQRLVARAQWLADRKRHLESQMQRLQEEMQREAELLRLTE